MSTIDVLWLAYLNRDTDDSGTDDDACASETHGCTQFMNDEGRVRRLNRGALCPT
jgi:hypothetical protein